MWQFKTLINLALFANSCQLWPLQAQCLAYSMTPDSTKIFTRWVLKANPVRAYMHGLWSAMLLSGGYDLCRPKGGLCCMTLVAQGVYFFLVRFSTCYNSIQSMVNWSRSGLVISYCHCSTSLSFHILISHKGGLYVQGSSSFLCESLRGGGGYSTCILMDCLTPSQPSNICL